MISWNSVLVIGKNQDFASSVSARSKLQVKFWRSVCSHELYWSAPRADLHAFRYNLETSQIADVSSKLNNLSVAAVDSLCCEGAAFVNTPSSTFMYGGHFRDASYAFSVGDTIRQFTRNEDGKLNCKMIKRPDTANIPSSRQSARAKTPRSQRGKRGAEEDQQAEAKVWPTHRSFSTLVYVSPLEEPSQAQEEGSKLKKDAKVDKKGKGSDSKEQDELRVPEPEDAATKERVFLIGGRSQDKSSNSVDMNTAWIYHLDQQQWYNPQVSVNEGAVEYYLSIEADAIEQQQRIISQFLDEDTPDKKDHSATKEELMMGPPPRVGHSATFHPSTRCIVVMGGKTLEGKLLNDVWMLRVDTLEWLPLPPQYSNVPFDGFLREIYTRFREAGKENTEGSSQEDIEKELEELTEDLETETKVQCRTPAPRCYHSAQTIQIERNYCFEATRKVVPVDLQESLRSFAQNKADEKTSSSEENKGKGKGKDKDKAKGKAKGKAGGGKGEKGAGGKGKGADACWPLENCESNDLILVHGGLGPSNDRYIWALDIVNCGWRLIKADNEHALGIDARYCHKTFVHCQQDTSLPVENELEGNGDCDNTALARTYTWLHILGGSMVYPQNLRYYICCAIKGTASAAILKDVAPQSHPIFEEKDIPAEGYGQVNYKDGSVYLGHFRHYQRWGYGEISFANGDTYKGDWQENLPHGEGSAVTPTWSYTGTWRQGRLHGKGAISYHTNQGRESAPLGGEHLQQQDEDGMISPGSASVQFGASAKQSVKQERLSIRSAKSSPASPNRKFRSPDSDSFGVSDGNCNSHTPGQYIVYQPNTPRTLPNEAYPVRYDGQWHWDLRHGYGCCEYSNGYTYEGYWKDDVWHGQGLLYYSSDSYYDGMFKAGYKEGEGKEVLREDGEVYRGGFSANFRHGNGILEKGDGSKYEGEYRYGKKAGSGKEVTPTLDVYMGKFQQNMYHGRGKMEYKSGAVYEGTWLNGKHHGEGWLRDADGSEYTGSFEFGVKSGIGICHYDEDCYYEGEWANDRREGHGICRIQLMNNTYAEHQGEWKDGVMHGHGILRSPFQHDIFSVWAALQVIMQRLRDPAPSRQRPLSRKSWVYDASPREETLSVFEGDFKRGHAVGTGELRCASGDVYCGSWRSNLPNGHGVLTLSTASSPKFFHLLEYRGNWQDFYPHGEGAACYDDGSKYEGSYSKATRHGYGVCTFEDGSCYKGQWKEDLQHGDGVFIRDDGQEFQGKWANGLLQSSNA
eukprot:gb/GECG01010489.1/.p1 GENE.gb/GECG01010489.1/~~gb/GECG01010489.1/.p1  ORF type:complete len:1249 (+),score=196.77 gb/GECG01010489.1/:1-3747(+)